MGCGAVHRKAPKDISYFIRLLEWYRKEHEDPEHFCEVEALWEQYSEDDKEGFWRNLAGPSKEKHLDFSNFCNLMMEDMGCEQGSCQAFKHLAKQEAPKGFMECTKILAHMLKDKKKAQATQDSWDSLLHAAVRESRWALEQGPDLHEACKAKCRQKGKPVHEKGAWHGHGKGYGSWWGQGSWWAGKGTWGGSSSSSGWQWQAPGGADAAGVPAPIAGAPDPDPWAKFKAKDRAYHQGPR